MNRVLGAVIGAAIVSLLVSGYLVWVFPPAGFSWCAPGLLFGMWVGATVAPPGRGRRRVR